ncbi:MAG TPA: DNA repair protein RadC [Steroidobacteraceae bacterium]|nr:DNA repair protein RadC [Steroidobacteraceae bacterium]
MQIRDWPLAERPREKLLDLGPGSLSEAELLAIWLRHGIRGASAVDVARGLLARFGSLRNVLAAGRHELCGERGVGPARWAELQAALELVRRHHLERLQAGPVLGSPRAARDYLVARLRDLEHEVFCCLFLDSRHRLTRCEELFRGTVDGASVHPREVVKQALVRNATAVILAHNHPSGVAEPSQADEIITTRLRDALALVEIRLLDHLIIGDGSCISLAEKGLI